jgi:hypothetical protein
MKYRKKVTRKKRYSRHIGHSRKQKGGMTEEMRRVWNQWVSSPKSLTHAYQVYKFLKGNGVDTTNVICCDVKLDDLVKKRNLADVNAREDHWSYIEPQTDEKVFVKIIDNDGDEEWIQAQVTGSKYNLPEGWHISPNIHVESTADRGKHYIPLVIAPLNTFVPLDYRDRGEVVTTATHYTFCLESLDELMIHNKVDANHLDIIVKTDEGVNLGGATITEKLVHPMYTKDIIKKSYTNETNLCVVRNAVTDMMINSNVLRRNRYLLRAATENEYSDIVDRKGSSVYKTPNFKSFSWYAISCTAGNFNIGTYTVHGGFMHFIQYREHVVQIEITPEVYETFKKCMWDLEGFRGSDEDGAVALDEKEFVVLPDISFEVVGEEIHPIRIGQGKHKRCQVVTLHLKLEEAAAGGDAAPAPGILSLPEIPDWYDKGAAIISQSNPEWESDRQICPYVDLYSSCEFHGKNKVFLRNKKGARTGVWKHHCRYCGITVCGNCCKEFFMDREVDRVDSAEPVKQLDLNDPGPWAVESWTGGLSKTRGLPNLLQNPVPLSCIGCIQKIWLKMNIMKFWNPPGPVEFPGIIMEAIGSPSIVIPEKGEEFNKKYYFNQAVFNNLRTNITRAAAAAVAPVPAPELEPEPE